MLQENGVQNKFAGRMTSMAKKKNRAMINWLMTIIISLMIVLVFTMFVRPSIAKGKTFYPILGENDYVLMNNMPYVFSQPQYNDIIILKSSLLSIDGSKRDLVKKIIGLPGDKIEIKDGKFYRNDVFIKADVSPDEKIQSMNPLVIAENKVFVLGDEHIKSHDSKDIPFGEVLMEDIKGKIIIRLFPINQMGYIR